MNDFSGNYTINARKFDGAIHKSWRADLIERNDCLHVFKGVFDKEIKHPNLGIIRRGTVSYEYYWTNRWYNIFRFHTPEGVLRNYYCNVNQPPILTGEILDYVDLDIDVLVWANSSVETLDLEEFETNAKKYNYPVETIEKALNSHREILYLAKNKIFPLNFVG